MDNNRIWIFIEIGCVVAFILLIIVIIILLCHRKNKKEEYQEIEEDKEDLTIRPEFQNNLESFKIITSKNTALRMGKVHAIGKRKNQQDTFAYSDTENDEIIEKKGILTIVADGMGGLSNGAEVSSFIAVELLQYFDAHPMDGNPVTELQEMVNYVNERVNDFLGEDKIGKCGSTLLAAWFKNHQCYWLSIGDSEIFLYQNNVLKRINVLHNYETELKEKVKNGEMTQQEAFKEPNKAALTSYMGAGFIALMDQNTEPLILRPGDRLILMSDGVSNTITEQELIQMMHFDVEEAALRLRYLIESKNKKNQDNFTAILIEDDYEGDENGENIK